MRIAFAAQTPGMKTEKQIARPSAMVHACDREVEPIKLRKTACQMCPEQAILLNPTETTGLLQNLVSSRHWNVITHVFIRLDRRGITEAVVTVHI